MKRRYIFLACGVIAAVFIGVIPGTVHNPKHGSADNQHKTSEQTNLNEKSNPEPSANPNTSSRGVNQSGNDDRPLGGGESQPASSPAPSAPAAEPAPQPDPNTILHVYQSVDAGVTTCRYALQSGETTAPQQQPSCQNVGEIYQG